VYHYAKSAAEAMTTKLAAKLQKEEGSERKFKKKSFF
jgi:hypothetical protein